MGTRQDRRHGSAGCGVVRRDRSRGRGRAESGNGVAPGAFCARLPPSPGTALSPQIGQVADNAEHDRRRGRGTNKARDPFGRIDGGCTSIAHNKDSADCRAGCRGLPSYADAHLPLPL
jgi:hypothetical protein